MSMTVICEPSQAKHVLTIHGDNYHAFVLLGAPAHDETELAPCPECFLPLGIKDKDWEEALNDQDEYRTIADYMAG